MQFSLNWFLNVTFYEYLLQFNSGIALTLATYIGKLTNAYTNRKWLLSDHIIQKMDWLIYWLKMNSAKHLAHGWMDNCSFWGICLWNWKAFHHTVIISVSIWSMTPPFMYTKSKSGCHCQIQDLLKMWLCCREMYWLALEH